jgi:hypothetical protein
MRKKLTLHQMVSTRNHALTTTRCYKPDYTRPRGCVAVPRKLNFKYSIKADCSSITQLHTATWCSERPQHDTISHLGNFESASANRVRKVGMKYLCTYTPGPRQMSRTGTGSIHHPYRHAYHCDDNIKFQRHLQLSLCKRGSQKFSSEATRHFTCTSHYLADGEK